MDKLAKKYFRTKVNPKDISKYVEQNFAIAKDVLVGKNTHEHLARTLILSLEDKFKIDSTAQELGLSEKMTMWNALALNETLLFAVLDYPECIKALSLYAIYKKVPMRSYPFEEMFKSLMQPVIAAYETGEFKRIYETKNPRDGMTILINLPQTHEIMREGLVWLETEALLWPWKSFSKYLSAGGGQSLFSWVNVNNKIRCFRSNLNQAKNALNRYKWNENEKEYRLQDGDSIEAIMEDAGIANLTPLEQKAALEYWAVNGPDKAAEWVARTLALNADNLF